MHNFSLFFILILNAVWLIFRRRSRSWSTLSEIMNHFRPRRAMKTSSQPPCLQSLTTFPASHPWPTSSSSSSTLSSKTSTLSTSSWSSAAGGLSWNSTRGGGLSLSLRRGIAIIILFSFLTDCLLCFDNSILLTQIAASILTTNVSLLLVKAYNF